MTHHHAGEGATHWENCGCKPPLYPDLIWGIHGLPRPVPEYRFHPVRKWRFDYAWIDQKCAVEIEGGIWTGGRHSRGSGFSKDMEKYNMAGKLGWRVFRFAPNQLKKGEAQAFMMDVLK